MNQSLSYGCLIDNHIKHVLSDHERLSTDDAQPQLWFLTATFSNQVPISPDRCIAFFERFYVWLLPRLMSNFERKRHLQPLVYPLRGLSFHQEIQDLRALNTERKILRE